MEWGLYEDKAMWNEDCMRTRPCGMRTKLNEDYSYYPLSHAVSRMFIWRKVMLLLIGKVKKAHIQLYGSTCVYDMCVHNYTKK